MLFNLTGLEFGFVSVGFTMWLSLEFIYVFLEAFIFTQLPLGLPLRLRINPGYRKLRTE